MTVLFFKNLLVSEIFLQHPKFNAFYFMLYHACSENLANRDIKELPEVIQSEMGQKQKLERVLSLINNILNVHSSAQRWSVDSQYQKRNIQTNLQTCDVRVFLRNSLEGSGSCVAPLGFARPLLPRSHPSARSRRNSHHCCHCELTLAVSRLCFDLVPLYYLTSKRRVSLLRASLAAAFQQISTSNT